MSSVDVNFSVKILKGFQIYALVLQNGGSYIPNIVYIKKRMVVSSSPTAFSFHSFLFCRASKLNCDVSLYIKKYKLTKKCIFNISKKKTQGNTFMPSQRKRRRKKKKITSSIPDWEIKNTLFWSPITLMTMPSLLLIP